MSAPALKADHEKVYTGVIEDHRDVLSKVGQIDPITEDLLIGQTAEFLPNVFEP